MKIIENTRIPQQVSIRWFESSCAWVRVCTVHFGDGSLKYEYMQSDTHTHTCSSLKTKCAYVYRNFDGET